MRKRKRAMYRRYGGCTPQWETGDFPVMAIPYDWRDPRKRLTAARKKTIRRQWEWLAIRSMFPQNSRRD